MADIEVEQKTGGQHRWIWATAAVVSVLALMLWLASQEADTGPVVMEDDTAADTVAGGATAAETVELGAIAAAPDSFAGRPVQVQQVEVIATLGPRAFWANISGQNPFLVVVDEGGGESSLVASGQRVNVRGTVAAVSEELVDQWIAGGAVNEGAREEATFATHYIQAEQMRPAS